MTAVRPPLHDGHVIAWLKAAGFEACTKCSSDAALCWCLLSLNERAVLDYEREHGRMTDEQARLVR
jgi:hypothetical protein